MKNLNAIVATLLSLALLVPGPATWGGPGAHGPNGEHLDGPATGAPASGLSRLPDGSVNIPKLAQRRMAIRTQLIPESETALSQELNGRVVIDPNAGGVVQATHGGRLVPGPQGLPVVGQAVTRGQVLAYVHHHAEPFETANQQAQLAELRNSRELAAQRLKRLEQLEGTVPRKEIEAARSELKSLQQRERSIGAGLSARETLVAPLTGVIAQASAMTGQVVEARDVLFQIVDPARVLVEANTADSSLPPRIAGASLAQLPGIALRFVGAARTLREGVLPMTFRAEASPGTVLPLSVGQPVTVIAHLKERAKGLVLPAQAIVRSPANEPVVWIKVSAERFMPQPVQFRPLDAQTVVVTRGLAPDNRVVVQGAPLIAQIR